MKLSIDTSWFRFLSDLPADEIKKISQMIWDYSNGHTECASQTGAWEVMKDIIDKKIESNRRRAEQNRINGMKHTRKRDNSEIPNDGAEIAQSQKSATDSKNESVVKNPFIALTDDPDIIAALKNPTSGLFIFLETGQGYEDALSRPEREFADRGDVRALCPWHRELMKASKEIKKFTQPTIDEWMKYCRELNLDEQTMRRAYESYAVANWHDTRGTPIRNWKQKILQVWNRPEHANKASAQFNQQEHDKSGLAALMRGSKMAEQMLKDRGIIPK